MPSQSHLINGKVYDIYGISLAGASVSVVHTNGTLPATTNSSGEYIVNLGSLSSWTLGDPLSIIASKPGEGSKTETTTISSGGGQTENITLEEEEQVEGMDSESRAKINKVILISYDKRDINRTNRLPVVTEDALDNYQPSDETNTGEVDYYGFLDRNGNWYIQQYDYNNGTIRYIRGSSDYTTNWTNRESLTYRYYNQVF